MPRVTTTSVEIDYNAIEKALESKYDTTIELSLPQSSDSIMIHTSTIEFAGYKPQRHICMAFVEGMESTSSEYFTIEQLPTAIEALKCRYNSTNPWLPTGMSDNFDDVFEKI